MTIRPADLPPSDKSAPDDPPASDMDRAGREGGEALYAKRKHCGTLKELLTIIGLALLLAGLPLLGLLAWDSMRSAP